MRKIVFCLFLLIPFFGKTQDSLISKGLSANYDERFRKNEFGLALNPLLVGMMGGTDYEISRFAIAYRRHLNEKFSIRLIFGLHYNFTNRKDKTFYQSEEIFYNSDSSKRNINNSYYDLYNGFGINSGIQYNWGKKKLKWFTGIDFFYNYAISNYLVDNIQEDRDTSITNFDFYHTISNYNVTTNTRISHQFGVMPFVGLRAYFNKHWGFSTHFGINLFYADETRKNYFLGELTSTTKSNSLNLYSLYFFQDVSLVFRF